MRQLSLTEAIQFMNELFAIWTETDHASRRAAIEAHYHPDIHFNDPDGEFIGYQALEGFSDSLQQRFPGARFELVGQPETVGNALRQLAIRSSHRHGLRASRPGQSPCPLCVRAAARPLLTQHVTPNDALS